MSAGVWLHSDLKLKGSAGRAFRLPSYTDQIGAVWRYTYDERGNLLTETDPRNATWRYTYNERNQRLSQRQWQH